MELLDIKEDLKTATGIEVTLAGISSFQEKVGKPFISLLKGNISSRFSASKEVLSAFSVFDPKKVPDQSSTELCSYGDNLIQTLMEHYGKSLPAKSVEGTDFLKEAIISSDVSTEWKTYRQLIAKQPKDSLSTQLKELLTNSILIALLPNLHTLALVCSCLPVSTASAERSFSQMKLIKNRFRNRLTEESLSSLMKIVIECPETLSDNELEEIVEVWKRKGRRITV